MQAQKTASKQEKKREYPIDADLPDRIGRYQTQEILGVGGFGVVVSALDDALGSPVAIKILGSVHAADPDIRKRFIDEARLLRNVRSDHLITIHDIGELDDGRPFFVMDLADRGTFADRLGVGRGSAGIDAVSLQAVVTALTESLSALHAAGYVHRDVSPGNLLIQGRSVQQMQSGSEPVTVVRSGLVGSEERLLLGDLGLAKDVVGASQVTIIGGTPRYSSPEQVDPDGEVGPGTDVYGATAVIWRVVTGELPPEYHKLEDSLSSIGTQWHAFMLRGMAPTIEQRFPNMQAWQTAAMAAFNVSPSNGISIAADRYGADMCPYQGLAAFQTRDADRFYGRDEMVRDLVARLRRHRVLVVGGASGSGKSSLVRAGLIPAIRSGALSDSARWPVMLFTPGADPLAELKYQLRKTLDNLHVVSDIDANSSDDSYWRRTSEQITDITGGMVICIDQFEELFTFDHDHDTLIRVFNAFASMSDPSMSLVRLVFVIRADFYASSSRYQWLAEAITQSQVLVGPMSKNELHKAITEPARLVKLKLDDDLVETVLEEVGTTAGTLPLVSHALSEAWKLRKGNRLTLENYRATGGMFGAIGQSAETLYTQQFDAEEQVTARRLLLRLVNPGEGVPDTRRPFLVADLLDSANKPMTQKVMDALVEARLLTIDNNIIQLAHEAIILSWHRLRDWISESRDDLRILQRIERVANEWDESGRDPDLLYHGAPLLSALEWFESHKDTANVLETDFLNAAEEAEKQSQLRELEAAKRAKRNRRLAFSALTFLLIASLISSIIAINAYKRSRSNEIAANFRLAQSLASQASDLSERNPRLALALAAEVIERQSDAPVDARVALVSAAAALEAAAYTPFASLVVGDAITIAVHPTEDLIVTGYRDGSVGFWNTAGVSLGEPIMAHGGAIEEIAFSPDGKRMVSVGLDGTAMEWQISNSNELPTPKLALDLDTLLWGVAFSPDGQFLALATEDGAVRLYTADNFQELYLLEDIERDFLTVQFTPDSQRLFAGNGRGLVWSWSTATGEETSAPFFAHESDVWEIEFYPDGSHFITASSDGRVRVWDTETLTVQHEPFEGFADDVRAVQFDAKGRILAGDESGRLLVWNSDSFLFEGASVAHHDSQIVDSAAQTKNALIATLGMDQVMRVWRGTEEKSYLSLPEHQEGAFGLAISPDGLSIATGDGSGKVSLFSTMGGANLGVPLNLSESKIWALAFDAEGELIAAADKEGTMAIWDVQTGRRLARVNAAHEGSVSTLAFHPQRPILLSAGADGVVKTWDVDSLSALTPVFAGHTGGVSRFAFSPDAKSLVVADRAGGIRVWDYDTAQVSQQWQADDNTIWSVAWSPDGKVLATAHADEFVRLWDVGTAAALRELTPHPGGATDVAFLADGVTLVSTSRDGTIRLWDRELGLRLGDAIEKPGAPLWRVVGSQTGNWFATSSASGQVKLWNTLNKRTFCRQAAWDNEAQRRYLGVGEQPLACQ